MKFCFFLFNVCVTILAYKTQYFILPATSPQHKENALWQLLFVIYGNDL